VLYIRVGSGHPDDIASASRWQRARLRERAAAGGWTIAGEYADAATPASRRFTDRPGARALIEHVTAAGEGVDAVLMECAYHAFGGEQIPAVLAALAVPVYHLTSSGALSPVVLSEFVTRLPPGRVLPPPVDVRPGGTE
jgi:hypothetical protein